MKKIKCNICGKYFYRCGLGKHKAMHRDKRKGLKRFLDRFKKNE